MRFVVFGGSPKEEIGVLLLFFLFTSSHIHGFHCIGVKPGVEHCRSQCHRRGGEVLHLLRAIVHLLAFLCQLLHIGIGATRVRRDEVWYDLLLESRFSVDLFEEVVELLILLPCGLTHDL